MFSIANTCQPLFTLVDFDRFEQQAGIWTRSSVLFPNTKGLICGCPTGMSNSALLWGFFDDRVPQQRAPRKKNGLASELRTVQGLLPARDDDSNWLPASGQ